MSIEKTEKTEKTEKFKKNIFILVLDKLPGGGSVLITF